MSQGDLAKVVSVIEAHGLAGRTWVQSTYGKHLASLRGLAPRCAWSWSPGRSPP